MNTTTITEAMSLTHFDVRFLPCRQKHALIFARWAEVPTGGHFVLVNDHDPVPLYYQFTAQFRGAFSWDYLVTGPDVFHVKITRLAASPERPASSPPAKPAAAPEVEIDARGLEPPEPMMCILAAVEAMKPGTTIRARTDRRPLHLHAELDARDIRYASEQNTDESWTTTLTRR